MITILMVGIISGCQKKIPKPETKPKIIFNDQTSTEQSVILPVYKPNSKEIPSLVVQHETRGNDVFVECIVTGISFRESDHSKEKIGKIVVWIDGRRIKEVASVAFILKGLSGGNHRLKLEVVQLNNVSYGLMKEFSVTIPK